ncbi:endonuclease/exonuclease/phosphatase family protein [Caulobacter segnis]
MRIAAANINNVLSRFDPLIQWLDDAQPDVVCLQELKAEQGRFPFEALEQMGYGAVAGRASAPGTGWRSWPGASPLPDPPPPCPASRTRTSLATSRRR